MLADKEGCLRWTDKRVERCLTREVPQEGGWRGCRVIR